MVELGSERISKPDLKSVWRSEAWVIILQSHLSHYQTSSVIEGVWFTCFWNILPEDHFQWEFISYQTILQVSSLHLHFHPHTIHLLLPLHNHPRSYLLLQQLSVHMNNKERSFGSTKVNKLSGISFCIFHKNKEGLGKMTIMVFNWSIFQSQPKKQYYSINIYWAHISY